MTIEPIKKNVLITGGCGFAGHHFVEHFLKNTDWGVYVFDKLTYAANGFDRVRDINAYDDKRVKFFTVDITIAIPQGVFKEVLGTTHILHLAAETHVDNSIVEPIPFVLTNVLGTANMLQFARMLPLLKAFDYFSTDEVFGPAPDGHNYDEWSCYNSTNPYSATKAGGEELALAWANTYGVPVFITHTMNMFGERQHPEKFIPLCIRKILKGEKITIHSDSTKTKPGSRFYIHARNVAEASHYLLDKFTIRDKYNIVGEKEVNNLQLAQFIGKVLGKDVKYELVDFHSSRPGHDLRYALDGSKMKRLGWIPPVAFKQSLARVVRWTVRNEKWVGA